MPSPQRRMKYRADLLSLAERLYLMTGSLTGDGGGVPFADPTPDGWEVDMAAAERAWRDHRSELIDAMPAGLLPWAAVQFDGAVGASSYYVHLRGPAGRSGHLRTNPIGDSDV